MKLLVKLNLILFFQLFTPLTYSQNNETQNTFSLKLNVPVILNEKIKKEYVPERMQDINQEYIDKKTSFTIDAKTTSLNYAENKFWGNYENPYFPNQKVTIRGRVSGDHMILKSMVVTSNWEVVDQYRKESKNCEIHFENVPMYYGYCLFDKKISKVKLINYNYSKTEISRDYYTYTNTRTAKEIDLDEIPSNPKLATWKFRIQLKMDGPPSYIIDITDVRGEDKNWQPPAASAHPDKYPSEVEPQSLGLYKDKTGLDEISKNMTDALYNVVLNFKYTQSGLPEPKHFVNIKGLKLVGGGEIDKILKEIELSNSGLVSDETKVASGNLFKEEIAV